MTTMQPLRMYFPPSEYMKKIKLSTRCFYIDFLDTLDSLKPKLTTTEKKWFVEHPQFQHIFHLPKQGNHKVMGMWMLLLRTACIEKRMEVWFVVYGVPIRYGLREHALISGLDCRNYPVDFKRLGGLKFVRKHFGNAVVRIQDVKDKLEKMGSCPDRLQMIVLYFLCSVLIGQTKTGNDATPVVDFFLRAVDNLDLCRSFPWGRFCYDHMVGEISHTMDHFKGVVKENKSWPVPGFCIPLELLAFEAIPELGRSFREPVVGADHNCPRMCKSQFKSNSMRGFPLSRINEELALAKCPQGIENILPTRDGHEEALLDHFYEQSDVHDLDDPVVDSWMKLISAGKKVFFQGMYDEEKAFRHVEEAEELKKREEKSHAAIDAPGTSNTSNSELIAIMKGIQSTMEDGFKLLHGKFDEMDKRVRPNEEYMDHMKDLEIQKAKLEKKAAEKALGKRMVGDASNSLQKRNTRSRKD